MDKQKIFLAGFFGIVIVVVMIALVSVLSSVTSQSSTQQPASQNTRQRQTKMSLSPFDTALAKQFMDKNGDGKCDVCGMPVEMCIDSGQLQCNMDSKSTIGILDSQHIHSDFKVYVNGDPVDFNNKEYFMKSSFIHVDSGQNAEEASGLLHMHATGVPLWIFFGSIGLELPDAKAYVNGREVQDYRNYAFSNLDKILITDGVGNLDEQLNSITDFAKNH